MLEAPSAAREVRLVKLDQIITNSDNPRSTLGSPKEIAELAESIREVGLLEPMVACSSLAFTQARGQELPAEQAESVVLFAGHRRLAALRQLGVDDAECIIDESLATPGHGLVAMLVENLQRVDLEPIDEARAFAEIIKLEGLSQRELAAKVGRNQSHISRRLDLLTVLPAVQKAVSKRTLDVTAATELAKLAGQDKKVIAAASDAVLKGHETLTAKEIIAKTVAEVDGARRVIEERNAMVKAGRNVVTELPFSASAAHKHYVGVGLSVDMSPRKHAKLECDLITVDNVPGYAPKVTQYCATPAVHKKAVAPTSEEAKRKSVEAQQRAWAEATKTRIGWIADSDLLTYKIPVRELTSLTQAVALTPAVGGDQQLWQLASRMMGITPNDGTGLSAGSDLAMSLADPEQNTPEFRERAVRALALAIEEQHVDRKSIDERSIAYFDLLGRHGYGVSDAEQYALIGGDPNQPELPVDVLAAERAEVSGEIDDPAAIEAVTGEMIEELPDVFTPDVGMRVLANDGDESAPNWVPGWIVALEDAGATVVHEATYEDALKYVEQEREKDEPELWAYPLADLRPYEAQ